MADTEPATLADTLARHLIESALPGELEGFGEAERREAAAFVARVAELRDGREPAIALEPLATDSTRRRMRLAIINDDMPFLIDSIAATIGARDIAIDRILHPVLRATRDSDGVLRAIGEGIAESMAYLELERADARDRRELVEELRHNLADARAAVADWPALTIAMARDADALAGEGAALLRWFLDGQFTLLGHQDWQVEGGTVAALGLAKHEQAVPILAERSRSLAVDWFSSGGEAPLLLKSSLLSTVHRHTPLDLVLSPLVEGGVVTGLSIHAGLWTSAALTAPPGTVPVLRARLAELERKFGFDPRGHAGKALTHALAALPHDLTTAFTPEALEHLALTAMSLADRPRPKLVLVRSTLARHLFAFVWLPRDELSTQRRVAIGRMLGEAAGGPVINWSLALDDGVVALIRYTVDIRDGAGAPDAEALDQQLKRMVRGWGPQVEAALAEIAAPRRAAGLAARWADAFPAGYRAGAGAEEAAEDILRVAAMGGTDDRPVRLYRGADGGLRLKIYRQGGALALSDAVPVLENFGFRVLEEATISLVAEGDRATVHDFIVAAAGAEAVEPATLEAAISAVLEGRAENDLFNRLIVDAALSPKSALLFRAWFRYLRQAGLGYSMATVVDALRRAPAVAAALVARFDAAHDPARAGGPIVEHDAAIAAGLERVSALDDDRILRALRDLIAACLRTNAYAPPAAEALAFKFDSQLIPGLPAPVPWREMWVYSPRVEGIHLRAGPVARGGLRWSDRRDDFRTEILGLMKAQRVKNAVIVPTGAKGGFYPKQLPPAANRDAWLAEGTESYRVFIRAMLSLTDNIVDGRVVHPAGVRMLDGDDPYFVVAADKGTATFSDIANALALEAGFWLGDAFASGGSHGYDHKAMGITAKGAWISVQRHFAEAGVDVQRDPVRVVGCGDMSGDVFGNGMLLSRAIRLVAAFDHRHIFLDPDPDAEASFAERARLFALPRSSWADYAGPVSAGGGVHARAAKTITLTPQVRAMLGVDATELEPAALIAAILRAPVDLIWFGGIGTYVKAAAENNAAVGDPANDRLRVDAEQLRARAVGEGANLGLTQAARIAFAARSNEFGGGRINTDFIDNSAGVDCSDHEVNIKIALNREVAERRLAMADRNTLLTRMTDDVAAQVLEDNRLQTLALSIAQNDGARALPSYLRVIETFEASGRLNRAVEGIAPDTDLLRRASEAHGLTRPELAVLLATAKLALQEAIEHAPLATDDALRPDLHAAFPTEMREAFGPAIDAHRLHGPIVATRLANRIVNRLGILHPFELAEEEGAALSDIAGAFVVAERLFALPELWARVETGAMPEAARVALFDEIAGATRSHLADLLRVTVPGASPAAVEARLAGGVGRLAARTGELLLSETRAHGGRIGAALERLGAPTSLAGAAVRLFELDGAIGLADLGQRLGVDETELTRAFTRLGQALGVDWAQTCAARVASSDPWERLLLASLARDFQQIRLDFLARGGANEPARTVEDWLAAHGGRVAQFRALVDRARHAATPNAAMLAQIAGQARVLLGRV